MITAKHPVLCTAFLLACGLFTGPAFGQDFPIGDAFGRGHVEPSPSVNFPARNDNPGPVHRSLKAGVSDEFNQPVPVPDALLHQSGEAAAPWFYNDLLRQAPADQVQSRVYNREAFEKTRSICLIEFDNKTADPGRDERAARVVTHQISSELKSFKRYTVTVDASGAEDAHLKIVSPKASQPAGSSGEQPSSNDKGDGPAAAPALAGTTCQDGPFDAIMVGAVTRFINTYTDRHGKTREALSPTVEFGVYLVRVQPGFSRAALKTLDPKDVLWGARYVGSQATGLPAIASGQLSWYSKEELSRSAMKNVLKEFERAR